MIARMHRYPRREFLQAAGCAALGALAMPSWAQLDAAQPLPGGQAAGRLAFSLGRLGPRLIAAGVIDPARFREACARAGAPLTARSREILTEGGGGTVELDGANAHFLLNFFWAVGLANANALLTRGPMMRNGMGRIPGYASTGGGSLGARPAMDVYAHLPLISLTPDQQRRLEEVSSNVYRPCCDNPTSFPDCNHGMAMVGLLTLLAAEDRDVEALFGAAKAVNGACHGPDAAARDLLTCGAERRVPPPEPAGCQRPRALLGKRISQRDFLVAAARISRAAGACALLSPARLPARNSPRSARKCA
jgi:hypothetical protein